MEKIFPTKAYNVFMTVSSEAWGETKNGELMHLFSLNDEITVTISDYGGTITSIQTPDRRGKMGEVVLGFDSIEGYLNTSFYHGATIGRFANRIGGGTIKIDGVLYRLPLNDGVNHLHGGFKGFDKRAWTPEVIDEASLKLSYISHDKEEGYPGTLRSSITFTVIGDRLEVDYVAISDKPTVVNLTNHAYFNLGSSETVLHHVLWIDADNYTPVNDTLIPLGFLEPVEGTPFDFRYPIQIGSRIDEDNIQLKRAKGYDQNFALNNMGNPQVSVSDPLSGRVLEISTTMPGVQFYTGNFLDGKEIGRSGLIEFRSGLCLETQFFPDSPNKPSFPSPLLRPGEKYIEKTVYRFTVMS